MRSYTVEAGGGGAGDTVHCTLAVVTPDTGPAPESDSNKPPQPTTHPIPGQSATHSTARQLCSKETSSIHQQYNITTTQIIQ